MSDQDIQKEINRLQQLLSDLMEQNKLSEAQAVSQKITELYNELS